MGRGIGIRIRPHRTELEDLKYLLFLSDAVLLEEYRPLRCRFDQDGQNHIQEREHKQGKQGKEDIEEPLEG